MLYATKTREGKAMRFRAEASVGNGEGVFDAAYYFGDGSGEEAAFTGSPQEIGDAVARYLAALTPENCRAMKYGTEKFFVQLLISPEDSPKRE
jgi:hypothetical protein